jgi:hypothetical protein
MCNLAVQSVPYWVDDDSVRQSMIASAAMPPPILNQAEIEMPKPRTGDAGARAARHPLLGAAPTLQLIQENQDSHSAHPPHSPLSYRHPIRALCFACTPYTAMFVCICSFAYPGTWDSCLHTNPQTRRRLHRAGHDVHRDRGPPKANFFDRIISADKPRLRTMPMKVEPKIFFANERTFLHWLHMAVTIGSISAALLGFASTADR